MKILALFSLLISPMTLANEKSSENQLSFGAVVSGGNSQSSTYELNTENYDEETERTESPNTQSSNLMINEIVNIRLALAKIPSDLKLCDEIGDRKVERMVYLLLGPKFKNISIGKEHRIGNRVYGFETEYPVYNVIPM